MSTAKDEADVYFAGKDGMPMTTSGRRATWSLLVLAAMVVNSITGAGQTTAALDIRARALLQGEVLRLTWPQPAAAIAEPLIVRAFEREWPAWRDEDGHWQSLVGVDLDQTAGEYEVAVVASGGTVMVTRRVNIEAGRFNTRTLKVNPDFVNPPKAVIPRIQQEAKLMQDVFASPAPARLWSGAATRPVPHRANSRFGERSVFNGEPRGAHTGTDFLSPTGTPIRAPQAGRVVVARDLYFSGGTVIIDHGLGLFSLLAHMSRIDAKEGSPVEAGTVVGLVGATGRVTGAHLHWGMRLGGARVDPLSLMAALDDSPTP